MNISSVIVRARPDKLAGVRHGITTIPGVEIHADSGDGRIVVTVEDGDNHSVPESIVKLHNLDGVIAASLVYQYSDDGLLQEPNP
jgi:nitrate reductase NapD